MKFKTSKNKKFIFGEHRTNSGDDCEIEVRIEDADEVHVETHNSKGSVYFSFCFQELLLAIEELKDVNEAKEWLD